MRKVLKDILGESVQSLQFRPKIVFYFLKHFRSFINRKKREVLASISLDGQVKIWNSLEGKKLVEFEAG